MAEDLRDSSIKIAVAAVLLVGAAGTGAIVAVWYVGKMFMTNFWGG